MVRNEKLLDRFENRELASFLLKRFSKLIFNEISSERKTFSNFILENIPHRIKEN
mgnify:CR=1 FL=1|jgi:hypothetical protein